MWILHSCQGDNGNGKLCEQHTWEEPVTVELNEYMCMCICVYVHTYIHIHIYSHALLDDRDTF